MGMELLPERGDAGKIVAGEAAPDAGDEQRSAREKTRRRQVDGDRPTNTSCSDQDMPAAHGT
jgi:hypothetical protein